MIRVEIDPNERTPENWVRTGSENVLGPIVIGAEVEVFEPEAKLVGRGRIERYNEEYGLVYVSVDWDSIWFEDGAGGAEEAGFL